MAHRDREVEIKLAVENAVGARRLLRRAGFRVSRRKVFESNVVFDTDTSALRSASTLLRLREAGKKITLTYKGPPTPGQYKSREELETGITNSRGLAAILDRLGFHPAFRYEKYRTEYRQPGVSGEAVLDETPIGIYMELEGSPRWIDAAARKMGFPKERYITASYAGLYLQWCREHGVEPSNMVFRNVHGRKSPAS